MHDRIRQAFDVVKAEEALKDQTLQYINSKAAARRPQQKHSLRRMAVALASVCILALCGGFSYRVYATPAAYVDVDVNPSIELTINRFDQVIGVYAYNEEGEKVLGTVSLKNKRSQEALDLLLLAMEKEGYLESSRLLSITVQSDGRQKELLETVKKHVGHAVGNHHASMEQEIFAVDEQTKEHAHSMDVSPAQYLAIQKLQEADPSVTVEECQEHTISELRDITSEHETGHHETGNEAEPKESSKDGKQSSEPEGSRQGTEGHACPDAGNCRH